MTPEMYFFICEKECVCWTCTLEYIDINFEKVAVRVYMSNNNQDIEDIEKRKDFLTWIKPSELTTWTLYKMSNIEHYIISSVLYENNKHIPCSVIKRIVNGQTSYKDIEELYG